MIRTALSAALFALTTSAATAATLYTEGFDNQEGIGVRGFGHNVTTGNETWTMFYYPSQLEKTADHFEVINGRISANDIDGPVFWYTPVIDVSDYTNLKMSAEIDTQGKIETWEGPGGDYINIEYSLDGGSTFTLLDNVFGGVPSVTLTGDFGSYNLDHAIGDGTDYQMRITFYNNADAEYFFLDNVALTGDLAAAPEVVPLPAAGLLLLSGVLGLAALRRTA